MKKCVILSFAGLLLLSACKFGTEKKLSTEEVIKEAGKMQGINAGAGNFDFEVPAGWQRLDTTITGLKMTFIFAPNVNENFRANANVLSQSMNGMSADKFFNENVTAMSNNMPQFVMIEKGEKEVGGLHGYFLHYSAFTSGRPLEQELYLIPGKGIAYLLTCTSLKGHMDKDKAGFDQIVSSFKIH